MAIAYEAGAAYILNTANLDVTVNVPAGLVNPVAIIGVCVRFTYGTNPTSVTNTTDSTTPTLITRTNSVHHNAIYYQTGIGSGNKTFRVAMSGSFYQSAFVVIFSGVDQSSPIRAYEEATGANNTVTVNVTSQVGDTVVDCAWVDNGAWDPVFTVGANQTERINYVNSPGTNVGRIASSTEAGAATVTMSWTSEGNKEWTITGASLIPATTASLATRKLLLGVGI